MKKDLSKISNLFPSGQFKIIDINVDHKDNPEQQLMVGGAGYNIKLLRTDLGRLVAKAISDEFIKKEVKESKVKTPEFLNELIKNALDKGRRYEYEQFNYYQHDNVAAEEETSGLPLGFIAKVAKGFEDVGTDSKITYIYTDVENENGKIDTFIVGYKELDGTILFIMGGVLLPRQTSLLD